MALKKCPVCGVPVKLENMERHVKKQHPQDDVDLRSYLSKEEVKKAKIQKPSAKRGSSYRVVGLISIIIVVIIIIAFFATQGPPGETGPTVGTNIGQRSPDFSVRTTDSVYISLSSYHGKPVFLTFIEIDGDPCKAECEIFATVYADYSSSVYFLSIDVDLVGEPDTEQKINDFRTAKNTPWPYVLDNDQTVTNTYGIVSKPSVFIIDEDGIIQKKFIGRASGGYASYAIALDDVLG